MPVAHLWKVKLIFYEFDWLFASIVIGERNYYGFDFTTLKISFFFFAYE